MATSCNILSNDVTVASSFYRIKKLLCQIEHPVCRLLKGPPSSLPILEELSARGCFQLELPENFVNLNREVFQMSRQFLDLDENHPLKMKNLIKPGSLNGYHGYGGLSKYNENRWYDFNFSFYCTD
jgi:hypothetical protein